MEHAVGSLTSLMIVVAVAFFVPIFIYKFKLPIPVVVAEIIVGLALGKSGFGLAVSDPWLDLLSLFGFIYLMFLSGLEIDFSFFNKKGNRGTGKMHPLLLAAVLFAGVLAVSYGLSLLLVATGFISRPYLMTLIIATVSLGVVVPVLKEKKLTETPFGQVLLLVTVLADFLTMLLLAVYISTLSANTNQMLLVVLFFLIVVLSFFILRRIPAARAFEVLRSGTVQIGTRAVFALILLFVVLSETMGVDNILGAFLAGVVVSLLAPEKQFKHQLESFGYGFLIPIFFVMVGVKMDLWTLFSDWRLLLLMPLLLAFFFVAKTVPALLLRIWFPWRETIGAGVLLSTKLSLVIAASTIALKLNLIDAHMNGALILVAVLSSVVFPIAFNKMFPDREPAPAVAAIAGANHMSIPVARDLAREGYIVRLYSERVSTDESALFEDKGGPKLVAVPSLEAGELERSGFFEADTAVIATHDDAVNIGLAEIARAKGVEGVVLRVEDPESYEEMQRRGYTVFSTLHASRTLLKALVENPSAVRLITQDSESIREVEMNNGRYHGTPLRQLPFLGDVLILRIYRGEAFLVPHGNTEIQLGDRLLVTGQPEHIERMRRELA